MAFADLQVQILEDFAEVFSLYGSRSIYQQFGDEKREGKYRRGGQARGFMAGVLLLPGNALFPVRDPAEDEIDPWDWRRKNSKAILISRRMRPYGRRKRRTREILAQLRQDRVTQRALRAGAVSACGQ